MFDVMADTEAFDAGRQSNSNEPEAFCGASGGGLLRRRSCGPLRNPRNCGDLKCRVLQVAR